MTVKECPLGGPRCPESVCDCFIDTFPDDPGGLHPEVFAVGRLSPNVTSTILCMYGFRHEGETETIRGFACDREEHARAAVFGR